MKKLFVILLLILPSPPAYSEISLNNLSGYWQVTSENSGVRESFQIKLIKVISKFNHLNYSGTVNKSGVNIDKISIDPISKFVAIYHWKTKLTFEVQYYSIIKIEQNTLIIGYNNQEYIRMRKLKVNPERLKGGTPSYRVH